MHLPPGHTQETTPIATKAQHPTPNTHLTVTPTHRPISSPSPLLEPHHASRTATPAQAITSNPNPSPNKPRISTRYIQTHHHHLPTHNHTPFTWPPPLMVETSAHTYLTKNPDQPTIRPLKGGHPQDTCTHTHTHSNTPRTYPPGTTLELTPSPQQPNTYHPPLTPQPSPRIAPPYCPHTYLQHTTTHTQPPQRWPSIIPRTHHLIPPTSLPEIPTQTNITLFHPLPTPLPYHRLLRCQHQHTHITPFTQRPLDNPTRGPFVHKSINTRTHTHAPPHTFNIQPYKKHKQTPPTAASIPRYIVNKETCNKLHKVNQRPPQPYITVSSSAYKP